MRALFVVILVLSSSSAIAAPPQRGYEHNEMSHAFGALRHEVGNQQVEMRIYEEKLQTLDSTLEAMRQDLVALKMLQKDKFASTSVELDGKIGSLDLSSKVMQDEIKTLKTQINEGLNALKSRLGAVENAIKIQNQNVEALQLAMSSIVETFQAKDGSRTAQTYIVKNGDSLDKIARLHKMTIEELKSLNGLTTTKIIIGQKLLVNEQ